MRVTQDEHHRSMRSPPRAPAAMDHSHHRWALHNRDAHYRDRDRSVSPPRRQYLDRDREGYRSPRRRSRSNSRSGEREREQSPWRGVVPSRDVIMEGLPMDLLEQDVGFPHPLTFLASLRSLAKFWLAAGQVDADQS
jgi:hypothetical protein